MKAKNGRGELIILFLILGLAAFLRFYKLAEYQFFNYDQARDALIIKRIIVDKKLTLLGPTVLIPGLNLPPFYYYLMAPVLWLGGFNPLSLDFFSALVGLLTILAVWLVANSFFEKPAGLFAAFFMAISPIMVDLSRRAWNPNSVPFLSIIFFWLIVNFFKTGKHGYLYPASIILGFSLSFHYSVICLFPLLLWGLFSLGKKKFIKNVVISFLFLIIFISPLFIFETRHNFSLIKSLQIFLIQKKEEEVRTLQFSDIASKAIYLLSGVPFGFFNKDIQSVSLIDALSLKSTFAYAPVSVVSHQPQWIFLPFYGLVFLGLIIWGIIKFRRQYFYPINVMLVSCLCGLVALLIFPQSFHFYFLDFLFPLPFLFLGLALKGVIYKKNLQPVIIILFIVAVIGGVKFSLRQEGSNPRVEGIVKAAEIISNDIGNKTFNLAVNHRYPDRWDRNAVEYRYFIEAYSQKKSLGDSPEEYSQADWLYFIDEGNIQDVLNVKIMEVEKFKPKKILSSWESEGIKIYKLAK